MSEWRVGRSYAIHVYEGDTPVCTAMTPEFAAQIVRDHNAALSAKLAEIECAPRTSFGHCIRYIAPDLYLLSWWTADRKYAGSGPWPPALFCRDADEAGALRFAKRWGASLPTCP